MSVFLRYVALKVKRTVYPSFMFINRNYSDDKPDFCDSTIIIENGFNLQELPVIVRKLKDVSELETTKPSYRSNNVNDSHNYYLIQSEFNQCINLRDVFALLSKCTKITPNIALCAMERIYTLENCSSTGESINVAKGAIVEKLAKVVLKTEDTQTILNILKTVTSFLDPYKQKFRDELLLRVMDSKLSIEQLCEFAAFLHDNKGHHNYCELIDRLWIGFLEKEKEINEKNIVKVFSTLSNLKKSKRIIQSLLEQKLSELWYKINISDMQDILSVFIVEKYISQQSYAVVGKWLYSNIHALNEDELLDVVTKFTHLQYNDQQIERAVEKYMKLKSSKIQMPILIVGILQYCMQFQIRSEPILNACSSFFIQNNHKVQPSFFKSIIYPFGFLNYDPSPEFWLVAEEILCNFFNKINSDDMCSITLSCIYVQKYPLKSINKLFNAEFIARTKDDVHKKINLIDTALSLECFDYIGPLLPKNQCSKSISSDVRIKNITEKIIESLLAIAGGREQLSTAVLIPNLCSDETYLIDIMIHPTGLGSATYNWKVKSKKNQNTAVLIHLQDHFCSNNKNLIGPQAMRKRHLKLLGMKVASLRYSVLSQLLLTHDMQQLEKYLRDNIENAECCF